MRAESVEVIKKSGILSYQLPKSKGSVNSPSNFCSGQESEKERTSFCHKKQKEED